MQKIRVLKLLFSLFFTFTKAFSFFLLVKKVKNVYTQKNEKYKFVIPMYCNDVRHKMVTERVPLSLSKGFFKYLQLPDSIASEQK